VTELAPAACRNCGAAAGGRFCPECGQETAMHPPSAWEFVHEFIGHYIALEGALWRTLAALVHPGKLTNEYFAGRKRRYVLPLRLYLTASVVFFVVARVFLPAGDVQLTNKGMTVGGGVGVFQCDTGDRICERFGQRFKDRFGAMSRAQVTDYAMQRLVSLFPYAMFVLVPVFALLTRLAYWRRPFNYGEHLVFAFHVHAFAFFVGALVDPIGNPALMTVPVAIYLGLALPKVFGGRQWTSVLRFIFIFLTYFAVLVVTVAAIMVAAVIL
jgi:hypothetical protein